MDPYAASFEPITKAHQNVARTLHTIVFDPFHRRATLTACNGGVSSSDPGLTGIGVGCISSLGETEGGLASPELTGIVCTAAMSPNIPSICEERNCARRCWW
jgi:hypothetical protein